MLGSWVMNWSKGWTPHEHIYRNFAHRAWAMWDFSNHDFFQIIPDPGNQKRVTLSPESICTIPFQPRASDVKMPKLRQHSSNCIMAYFVNDCGTCRGTWDQRDKDPGRLYRCLADFFSTITNCGIQRPGMLIAWEIGQVSLVWCTYDWHNRHSGRRLILCIPPPMAGAHLAVDPMTLRVS